MRLIAAIIIAAVSLTSCISVPLAARSDKGEKFVGSANATPFGGTFEFVSANGLRCYGTYNPWDHPGNMKKALTFKCSDGRYGTGTIALNHDLEKRHRHRPSERRNKVRHHCRKIHRANSLRVVALLRKQLS